MIKDGMDCKEKLGYDRVYCPPSRLIPSPPPPHPNRHVIMSLFALHPPPPMSSNVMIWLTPPPPYMHDVINEWPLT